MHWERCILGRVSTAHALALFEDFPPTRLSQQTPTLVIKHTVGCHDGLRPQEEITFSRMLVFKSARQSGKRETRQLSIYHREEEDVQAAE